MAKLKSIAFAVGILLLIGAALCLYFSLQNLSSIRPASAYEDMGVHTFVPEEVYPVQRENHATGRQKRNHPTTTVYIVRYRAEDGSGYQYKYESGSVESTAQNILEAGEPIERRVLSIPDEDGYPDPQLWYPDRVQHFRGPIPQRHGDGLIWRNINSLPPPYCAIIMATVWKGEYHGHRERRVDHAGTGLV